MLSELLVSLNQCGADGGRRRSLSTPEDGTLDSVAYYDILEHTRTSIRGAIRGETRRTPDGQLVVWDLVLKSPDRYAWHRTDWPQLGYTREIRRCSG